MEDGGKAPDGGGQQRNHHRPFFYIQPPSQPFYMYQQWQMNHPYGHYALPTGFNVGRPCLNPYQYVQYPGFVFPHAPLYPMDFRRMFEPRFPSPHWDNSARHQPPPPPPPPQPPGHRETASSEAQTDPSDAITKLIECLDKMHVGDAQGPDRELDSGVASQSSAMFSPTEEKKKKEQTVHPDVNKNESCLETPTSTFSTLAVYDGDSSHRSLEALSPQECWPGDAEEELPLDSSSVQEENDEPAEEQVVPMENVHEVASVQPDTIATDHSVSTCEEPTEQTKPDEADSEEKIVQNLQVDPSFQILKLPFELASEAKGIGRLSQSPYYYNYLSMPSTHERMSVLSPSLDELSSRDEMFSTDLEEVELVQRPVLAGGRRLGEVLCGGGGEILALGSRRLVCACCGRSLPRGAASRSKVHCAKMYLDEGESEEDGRYVRGCEEPIRVVVRKHSGPRKTQPLPPRLTKTWTRRGPTRDQTDPDQSQERRDVQEEEEEAAAEGGSDTGSAKRLCREESALEQSRWTEAAVRRKTTAPLQRQELPQRKLKHHRPRDEEEEPPPLHWDRGSGVREPPR